MEAWHGGAAEHSRAGHAQAKRSRPLVVSQTRKIITSVALIRAAAVCPGFSCISRAEREVMIDVIRWPPSEISTSASKPLMRTALIRPTS